MFGFADHLVEVRQTKAELAILAVYHLHRLVNKLHSRYHAE
jgi:hypothetical protein